MAENMKFCRSCGNQISADAPFCRFCGFKFDAPARQSIQDKMKASLDAGRQKDAAAQAPAPQNAPAAKFCRQCGNQVSATARFCGKCGFRFDAGAAQAQSALQASAFSREKNRRGGLKDSPIGAAARQNVRRAMPGGAQVKKRSKGVVAAVLAFAILLTGLGWPGWIRHLFDKPDTPPSGYDGGGTSALPSLGAAASVPISELGVAADSSSGVTVDFTEFLDLEGVEQVQIAKSSETYLESEDGYATVYEITAGSLHEPGGWFEIRLPYSTDKVESGENPAECVAAMYFNEDAQAWEPVLFEVDEARQELVISTDHLSKYASFQFVNAGRRMARVTTVGVDGLMFNEEDSKALLQELKEQEEMEWAARRVYETDTDYANRIMQGKIDDLIVRLVKRAVEFEVYKAEVTVKAGSALNDALGPYGDIITMMTLNVGAFNDEMKASLFGTGMPALDNGKVINGIGTVYNTYGKVCTGLAVLGLINAAAKEGKTSTDKLLLMKDTSLFLMGQSTGAAMGLCLSGANIIFTEISTMGQAMVEQVTDDMRTVYRWYMETENEYHKQRTIKEWYKILSNYVETRADDPDAAQYWINKEIDDYCNEFWTLEGSETWWNIVELNGQAGRGAPAQYMRDQITNEYKAELMDSLTAVFNKMEKDQEKKLQAMIAKDLNNAALAYSDKLTLTIQEELAQDQKNYEYANWMIRFAPLNDLAVKTSWQGKLDAKGHADINMTIMGYLLAGAPNRIDLWRPNKDPDRDPPDQTEKIFLKEPTTTITLGGSGSIDMEGFGYLTEWVHDYGGDPSFIGNFPASGVKVRYTANDIIIDLPAQEADGQTISAMQFKLDLTQSEPSGLSIVRLRGTHFLSYPSTITTVGGYFRNKTTTFNVDMSISVSHSSMQAPSFYYNGFGSDSSSTDKEIHLYVPLVRQSDGLHTMLYLWVH